MRKIKELHCPFCGELPKIDYSEYDAYSRTQNRFGIKFVGWASHWCLSCNPNKKMYAEGTPAIAWGHFERENNIYPSEELQEAEDKTLDSAARKWNKMVFKELKNEN